MISLIFSEKFSESIHISVVDHSMERFLTYTTFATILFHGTMEWYNRSERRFHFMFFLPFCFPAFLSRNNGNSCFYPHSSTSNIGNFTAIGTGILYLDVLEINRLIRECRFKIPVFEPLVHRWWVSFDF